MAFSQTTIFETYFRVSKHTGIDWLEVAQRKFEPSMMLLINRYHREIIAEIKHNKKLEREMNKNKFKKIGRMRR